MLSHDCIKSICNHFWFISHTGNGRSIQVHCILQMLTNAMANSCIPCIQKIPILCMRTAETVICHPMGHTRASVTCMFECGVVCGSHMLWWRRLPVEVRWGWRRVEGAWWRRLVWNESFHPLGNRAWQERSSLHCLKTREIELETDRSLIIFLIMNVSVCSYWVFH